MGRFAIAKTIEKASGEQKDRLLELVVRRQNLIEELADLERDYKKDKKELQEPLTTTETTIFALLEEIATGQKDLFNDPSLEEGGEDGAGDGEEVEDDD